MSRTVKHWLNWTEKTENMVETKFFSAYKHASGPLNEADLHIPKRNTTLYNWTANYELTKYIRQRCAGTAATEPKHH